VARRSRRLRDQSLESTGEYGVLVFYDTEYIPAGKLFGSPDLVQIACVAVVLAIGAFFKELSFERWVKPQLLPSSEAQLRRRMHKDVIAKLPPEVIAHMHAGGAGGSGAPADMFIDLHDWLQSLRKCSVWASAGDRVPNEDDVADLLPDVLLLAHNGKAADEKVLTAALSSCLMEVDERMVDRASDDVLPAWARFGDSGSLVRHWKANFPERRASLGRTWSMCSVMKELRMDPVAGLHNAVVDTAQLRSICLRFVRLLHLSAFFSWKGAGQGTHVISSALCLFSVESRWSLRAASRRTTLAWTPATRTTMRIRARIPYCVLFSRALARVAQGTWWCEAAVCTGQGT
jgi:hypothetical protein